MMGAIDEVIVYQSSRLHVRMNDSRSDEAKSSLLNVSDSGEVAGIYPRILPLEKLGPPVGNAPTVGGSRKQSCFRLPRTRCDSVQLSRAATPHMTTKPALPYGAPPGPVMYPSLASFKMRNSSFTRPR
jgi:hypothetical protein